MLKTGVERANPIHSSDQSSMCEANVRCSGIKHAIVCFVLIALANIADAQTVTWQASGVLTSVDTAGGVITEFPTATIGTPFVLTFTFDSTSSLSSTTTGASGTRYRYLDALVSVELTVGDVGLVRTQEGFASIDIWDDYTRLGFTDPPSDGFNIIWGVTSAEVGGFAQISLILRGPERLDLFTGPGLPEEPSPFLSSLSTTSLQFLDGPDSIIGSVDEIVIQSDFDPGFLLQELQADVTGVGPGQLFQRIVRRAQVFNAVPDDQATCAVMRFFDFQVRLIGRLSQRVPQTGRWKITTEQMDDLLGQSGAIQMVLGCN